jgi:hypothetical protein
MSAEVVITEHELPSDVISAIQRGRRIEAINILRESKSMGLANAQVLVDRAWRTHGPEKKIRSFADQPRGLTVAVKSLGMLLLIIAGYYFYTAP